jgi:hypothetical protein
MIYRKFFALIPIYGTFLILLTPYSVYSDGYERGKSVGKKDGRDRLLLFFFFLT